MESQCSYGEMREREAEVGEALETHEPASPTYTAEEWRYHVKQGGRLRPMPEVVLRTPRMYCERPHFYTYLTCTQIE